MRQLFRVGNIILVKTQDENGQLKIQTIDRLRLKTPTQFSNEEGKTVFQGIRVQKIQLKTTEIDSKGKKTTGVREIITGKPASYYIRGEFDTDTFTEVPAENVIHKFDCVMPGQMVGMPEGACVLNQLHDFEDLHILEMGASKLASKIATVETNATGEKNATTARTARLNIAGVNAAGATINRSSVYDYNCVLGSQEIAMFQGDSLKNFMVERPTIAQQDYWDFLLSQICVGYNTPKLLVLPYSLQGTVTRADLAVARDSFRIGFELVSQALYEIYEWWGIRDVQHNTANFKVKPPQDYNRCEIHPPDSPDVDIGYTAQSLAIEMELGVTNLAQVCGRRGIDWRSQVRQSAQIQKAIQDEAERAGVTPESISNHMFKSGGSSDPTKETEPSKESQTA